MNKETKKEIIKMVEEANCVVIVTDKNGATIGNGAMIMSCLAALIKSMREHMPDEMIKDAIELGFLSDEELNKRTEESIKEVLGDADGLKKLSELLSKLI